MLPFNKKIVVGEIQGIIKRLQNERKEAFLKAEHLDHEIKRFESLEYWVENLEEGAKGAAK